MLEAFFSPNGVAVIGASTDPSKLGYAILQNVLDSGYGGNVFAVNPKADEILGVPTYASVTDIPEQVDLVVVVVPARFVESVIQESGEKGVKGAIIITAGFREIGIEGKRSEERIVERAAEYGITLLGPNCLGLIDTIIPLNASFAASFPDEGEIAFMSQSGALCTAILDWAIPNGIGFSRFVSLGNKADLSELDFIKAWREDPKTNVILAYLEGVVDGGEFLKEARKTTREKPIIALKSGTTDAGQKAVSSHTGTLAGSERAYDAAFTQAGVLRADSVQDIFDFAVAFAYQGRIAGPNVAVVTNAGGPGIMATDAIERGGLNLARLANDTIEGLREALPPAASPLNPIDVLGDARADRYKIAIDMALADPNVDAVMVILTPQVMTEVEETARAVSDAAKDTEKPIVGCFMGQEKVEAGARIMGKHRVPNYPFPERAVAALKALDRYREWLASPEPEYREFDVDRDVVANLFDRVRAAGRLQLADAEASQVMKAYGMRLPQSVVATSPDDAVEKAGDIGYPVAMKIASPDILHKSDIGGVVVGVETADDVRQNFQTIVNRARRFMADADIQGVQIQEMVEKGREVIIGVSRDPQFGHLVLFGLGGIYVEVLKDVTFRIAPVPVHEAKAMPGEIRTYSLLRGVRGEQPADISAIVNAILRVSQLVTDFPEIVEMDINPLVVHADGAVAIDARMVLEEK